MTQTVASSALTQHLPTNPWLVTRYVNVQVPLAESPFPCNLRGDRFGRRFVPFSTLLREARLSKRQSEADLARLIGKDRSLICRLESERQDKIHASSDVILQLAMGLGLDVLEAYTAYIAEVRHVFRVVAYPDDPGPAGKAFGLPLPGAQHRLSTLRP